VRVPGRAVGRIVFHVNTAGSCYHARSIAVVSSVYYKLAPSSIRRPMDEEQPGPVKTLYKNLCHNTGILPNQRTSVDPHHDVVWIE
jgi:hypothetical protein